MVQEGCEEGGKARLAPRIFQCVNKRQCSERKELILQSCYQECRSVPVGVKNILQECQGHKELIIRHSRSHFLTHSARRRLLTARSAHALKRALQHASFGGPSGIASSCSQLCVSDKAPPFDLFCTRHFSIPNLRGSGTLPIRMLSKIETPDARK